MDSVLALLWSVQEIHRESCHESFCYHHLEQNSPEWYAIRAGKITPSNFHKLFFSRNKTINNYLKSLFRGTTSASSAVEKYHKSESMNVAALNWGKYHEDIAAANYELETGNAVFKCGFFTSLKYPRVGGSPDRIVATKDSKVIGLEIKCPFKKELHEEVLFSRIIPDKHMMQIQGYMWLLNIDSYDYVSYHPKCKIYIKRVKRDPKIDFGVIGKMHELLVNEELLPEEQSISLSEKIPELF